MISLSNRILDQMYSVELALEIETLLSRSE